MSRITSIRRLKVETERLYNLAVEEDESYVANGIVVHNCKSYLVPVLNGNLRGREIGELKPSDPALDKHVTLSD